MLTQSHVVRYFCDVTYDPFRLLAERDMYYGFVITIVETPNTIPTLFDTVRAPSCYSLALLTPSCRCSIIEIGRWGLAIAQNFGTSSSRAARRVKSTVRHAAS